MPRPTCKRLVQGMVEIYPLVLNKFKPYAGNLYRRRVPGSTLVVPCSTIS